jgi:hypothetical protein
MEMKMRSLAMLASVLVLASPLTARAQQGRGSGTSDSAFAKLQERGKRVMGVDQYTSAHAFETLPDGGRIVLARDSDVAADIATIRAHMKDVASRLARGDFSLSEAVHAGKVPGSDVMRAKRDAIAFAYAEVPRGGQVTLTSRDPEAVKAIHEFLAFQRMDHRTEHKAHQ